MSLLTRDIELRLDLTNRCNLRCVMCDHAFRNYNDEAAVFMSVDRFRRITDGLLHRINILHLAVGSEPLLNKDLDKILEVCREGRVPQIVMTTNLTLLKRSTAELITDGGLHELHVSMDGADSKTYQAVRQKDRFQRIINSIRLINELKEKKGSTYPRIVFNYVLMKLNFDNVREFVDLAAWLKIHEINCAEMRVPSNYNASMLPRGRRGLPGNFDLQAQHIDYKNPAVRRELASMVRYAHRQGVALNVPFLFEVMNEGFLGRRRMQFRHLLEKSRLMTPRAKFAFAASYAKRSRDMRGSICSFPWRQMVLTADGSVLPCCTWHGSAPLGNFHQAPLAQIWDNHEYDLVREGLRTNNLPTACATCVVPMKKRHGI